MAARNLAGTIMLPLALFLALTPMASFSFGTSPVSPFFAAKAPISRTCTQPKSICTRPFLGSPAALTHAARSSFHGTPPLRGSGLPSYGTRRRSSGSWTCLQSGFDSDDEDDWDEAMEDEDYETERMVVLRDTVPFPRFCHAGARFSVANFTDKT
jgi:hypothetical protein